jgi:hypothetical protein
VSVQQQAALLNGTTSRGRLHSDAARQMAWMGACVQQNMRTLRVQQSGACGMRRRARKLAARAA